MTVVSIMHHSYDFPRSSFLSLTLLIHYTTPVASRTIHCSLSQFYTEQNKNATLLYFIFVTKYWKKVFTKT